MLYFSPTEPELIINPFKKRRLVCAFHDIDGTHSLIRNWPPVMSIVLDRASRFGVPEGYDSDENVKKLSSEAGLPLPETDEFCVESAGLSALTQMEWALRRAVASGAVFVNCDLKENEEKIRRIKAGEELFPDMPDSPELDAFLKEHTPRLFRFYEKVLNAFCRDGNLEKAKKDPSLFRVPGSMEFLSFLHENGVKNYFVTGAVIEKGKGMFEEVETLGYKIGKGETVEDVIGSSWDEKLPKNVIMERLAKSLGVKGDEILITGDGRSEISAGASMGAVMISRLPQDALYMRSLHKKLGTNVIVPDYKDIRLYNMFG